MPSAPVSVRVQQRPTIGGQPFFALVETEHGGGIVARTAIHQQRHPNRLGGARFVPAASLEELAHLARGMTDKAAACALPIDGHKCLVTSPAGLPDEPTRARVLAAHLREVARVDPGIIVGPDMGSSESLLDRVAELGLLAHVTGLSRRLGGLEIDRSGYTAFGLVEAAEAALGSLAGRRVVVEGFGAVGAPAAFELDRRGARVVGVSCLQGTLEAPTGLDGRRLHGLWIQLGDDALAAYARDGRAGARFVTRRARIFQLPCELLLPAARTSVLCTTAELPRVRGENPEATTVEELLATTGVRCIVEGANHPLTTAAESFLAGRGVLVLPDVLVNCGGMIGCYFEWRHRRELLADPAARRRLDQRCRARIRRGVRGAAAALLSCPQEPRALVARRIEEAAKTAACCEEPGLGGASDSQGGAALGAPPAPGVPIPARVLQWKKCRRHPTGI